MRPEIPEILRRVHTAAAKRIPLLMREFILRYTNPRRCEQAALGPTMGREAI